LELENEIQNSNFPEAISIREEIFGLRATSVAVSRFDEAIVQSNLFFDKQFQAFKKSGPAFVDSQSIKTWILGTDFFFSFLLSLLFFFF